MENEILQIAIFITIKINVFFTLEFITIGLSI